MGLKEWVEAKLLFGLSVGFEFGSWGNSCKTQKRARRDSRQFSKKLQPGHKGNEDRPLGHLNRFLPIVLRQDSGTLTLGSGYRGDYSGPKTEIDFRGLTCRLRL